MGQLLDELYAFPIRILSLTPTPPACIFPTWVFKKVFQIFLHFFFFALKFNLKRLHVVPANFTSDAPTYFPYLAD